MFHHRWLLARDNSVRALTVVLSLWASSALCAECGDVLSPESTVQSFQRNVSRDNAAAAAACYAPNDRKFQLAKPVEISASSIKSRLDYSRGDVDEFNSIGTTLVLAVGDVGLDVQETIQGKTRVSTYWLRRFGDKWLIIGHAVWGDE